jgi:hypothetical protein
MGQRKEFARAGAAEDIPAIPAVMLSVCEGEGCSTSHANVGVDPLWGLEFGLLAVSHGSLDVRITHSTAINHTAGDVFSGREPEALVLEGPIDLVDIDQVGAAIGSSCPCLNELQHLALDSIVWGNRRGGLQQRCQVVHELARGDLGDEVCATVLDACVCELEWQLAMRQTPHHGGGNVR